MVMNFLKSKLFKYMPHLHLDPFDKLLNAPHLGDHNPSNTIAPLR